MSIKVASRAEELAGNVERLIANKGNMSEVALTEKLKNAFGGKADNLPSAALIEHAKHVSRLFANRGNLHRPAFESSLRNLDEQVASLNTALSPPQGLKGLVFSFFSKVDPSDKAERTVGELTRLIANRGNLDRLDFDNRLRSHFNPNCAGISTQALIDTVQSAERLLENKANMDKSSFEKGLKILFGNSIK